ncbi:MAG: EAL domain-containing protein [Pseudomonadota bacterium]|nr:EAL domain-containing protein [Pseudomonadota bacterium]
MNAIVTCLTESHDLGLLYAAAGICLIGVYASFSLAAHAARSEGRVRHGWAAIGIVSAGSTTWATHMIALLAYEPGLLSAFEPISLILSLLLAVAGLSLSMSLAIGRKSRSRRVFAGLIMGLSIATLHYVGQSSYLVTGHIDWDPLYVAGSIGLSMPIFAAAMVVAGERNRYLRLAAPPLLVAAIAILHVMGMTALQITYDPLVTFPPLALAPEIVAPIVAIVALGLIALAFLGLRFSIAARAQAHRDRKRLIELANLAFEGLAICENGIVTSANDSLQRLTGYDQGDLTGEPIAKLIGDFDLAAMQDHREYDAEIAAKSGDALPVRLLCRTVSLGSKILTVVALRDQSERLKSEATIRRLAYTDTLTGLTNRTHFNELLCARMLGGRAETEPFALLSIGVNRFKCVNDNHGHAIGDALLREVGQRISRSARKAEIVARFGDDDFALLQSGEQHDIEELAATIIKSLLRPFTIDGHVIEIAPSIGIAFSHVEAASGEALCRNAVLARHKAKSRGDGKSCIFEAVMLLDVIAQRELELDLRRALKTDEFEVHYQPQANAETGLFEGAEALVRWRHPRRGLVSPASFIPIAEDIGLIGAIGEKVLRLACREASSWPSSYTLAVNLSAIQLSDPRLVDMVAETLFETGFEGHRLELEVTETALLRDDARSFENLRDLKRLGVKIALDDFGTGYSSLSHLRRFPFDRVKIDQSFVRSIPSDPESVAIVQAIIMLAEKLKMAVTIEGVEEIAQHQFAVKEGCDQIQGYFLSRPVPQSDIRTLLTSVPEAAHQREGDHARPSAAFA